MVKVFEAFVRAEKELPCIAERNTHSPNSGHVTITKTKLAKFGFLWGYFCNSISFDLRSMWEDTLEDLLVLD